MKNNKLIYIALAIFIVLIGAWLGLNHMAISTEKDNVFSVSEIKHDNSTYKYVKEKCDSGFFASDSENCINLRNAR